ncbi:MAG: CRISPR system precrRNA processing endoribonuclease RAMP protein Cas6 [Promethearchaeia archaeon]
MYKIELILKSRKNSLIYFAPQGYIFRAIILDLVKQMDPKISHALHEQNSVKPYALNLHVKPKRERIDLKLHFFDEDLGEPLLNYILEQNHTTLEVRDRTLSVVNIIHGFIDLTEIRRRIKPIKKFNMFFPKATLFNTIYGDYPIRLPIPDTIFGNLAHLWNFYIKDRDELKEIDIDKFTNWIRAHVYVASHKIKTILRYIGNNRTNAGFQGHVSFRVKKPNSFYYEKRKNHKIQDHYTENAKTLNLLCKFGEYTNVGANRTASMGVINYYPKHFFKKGNL